MMFFYNNLPASRAFDAFLDRISNLLDQHALMHKLGEREISLKAKPWITKHIQFLMKDVSNKIAKKRSFI